jgi:hypothetical protein
MLRDDQTAGVTESYTPWPSKPYGPLARRHDQGRTHYRTPYLDFVQQFISGQAANRATGTQAAAAVWKPFPVGPSAQLVSARNRALFEI